jgi:hypothetical protein
MLPTSGWNRRGLHWHSALPSVVPVGVLYIYKWEWGRLNDSTTPVRLEREFHLEQSERAEQASDAMGPAAAGESGRRPCCHFSLHHSRLYGDPYRDRNHSAKWQYGPRLGESSRYSARDASSAKRVNALSLQSQKELGQL